jgi:hypothetical protein
MTLFRRTALAFLCASAVATLAGCGGSDSPAGTFFGPSVAMGNGTARSFVTLDNAGNPTAIGARFGETALTGLPSAADTQNVLALPAEAAGMVFDHLSLDWESDGHPPVGVYTTPHFDLHFYMLTPQQRDAIGPLNGNAPLPQPQFVPPGYVSGIDSVPRMGVHWLDSAAPELNPPKLFSKTFVYGFYKGDMVFIEPMVSKAFLDSKTSVTDPVKIPSAYARHGYYPTSYSVKYDAASKEYSITLEGLTLR